MDSIQSVDSIKVLSVGKHEAPWMQMVSTVRQNRDCLENGDDDDLHLNEGMLNDLFQSK